jgi:tetratricopeptide (TPR) repeat protein
MQRAWLALVVVALGCASVPIRKPDADALLSADQRVLAGCYDCLTDARATYERVAVGRARPLLIKRLFEVQVLIVLRERELALDWQPALEQARALAKELRGAAPGSDADAPPPLDADRVLALVDLVPPDDYGWPLATLDDHRRRRTKALSAAAGEFAWLGGSPLSPAVRAYLRMSLECGYSAGTLGMPRRPVGWKPELPADPPPLLAYRQALCGTVTAPPLLAVRDQVPTFVETSLGLGRLAVSEVLRTGQLAETLREVDAFYTRFPHSSSATYLRGSFHQLIEDWAGALPFYEATLALQPLHERALLGQTECLTRLHRPDQAIQSATRMVDAGMPFLGDALYWRAWNLRVLKRLPDARADSDRAKTMRVGSGVLTLAGIIEHDQDDLGPAELDLTRAVSLSDGRDCEAGWYLGLVHIKKAAWSPAAERFESTMACYETRQLEAESARRSLEARENVDLDFKTRQLAGLDASIRDSATQRAAAAFNAASFHAQVGNLERSRSLVEIAATDDSLTADVAALRKFLTSRER